MSKSLAQLLRESAAQYPKRVALEDPDRGTTRTYEDLDAASDLICAALMNHGVTPGDRIGLYGPKSIGTVTALFGALKADAAYVPVDPTAPPQRNAAIFADCTISFAIVATALIDGLRAAWPTEPLDLLEELGDDLVLLRGMHTSGNITVPAGLAYILYTSGSTGRPKGVVHTQSSALSFIDWCSDEFQPTPDDRFSSHAPFHFDLSILDLYVPIKHGATLVLISEDLGKQPLRLAPVIGSSRITVWYSTPTILRLLAEYGRLANVDCSALRLVLFAGEVFPLKHLRAIKSHWPHAQYFNLYGPTETNVCTYYKVPADIPEERTEPFPIGWDCSGDRTMVVDESHNEVDFGTLGELYASGGSVMVGYWNMPERTGEAFHVDRAGTEWYRTGDVVKESAEEGYLFVGRRDRMVKRRGYRVELGEIEAALYRHPNVKEAAVIALPDEENGVLIKSFMSMSDGSRPSLIEMKRFCAEHLQTYMIPDHFAFHESLPKTSTDKIAYEQLRELA